MRCPKCGKFMYNHGSIGFYCHNCDGYPYEKKNNYRIIHRMECE